MSARFTNPIARDGDFADPFVLRFNGRYYLYATNADLRCWSSSDLVSWKLEGPTIAGFVVSRTRAVRARGRVLEWVVLPLHLAVRHRAPGAAQLVADRAVRARRRATSSTTSTATSSSTTTARWYFYWAGDEGIWGCEMPTPTTFGEPVLTGAQMNGWTEGPFVMKRDGKYHMTLTGNHYLNPAYRINAAVSDHPLHGYVDDPLNPVLINVDGAGIGLRAQQQRRRAGPGLDLAGVPQPQSRRDPGPRPRAAGVERRVAAGARAGGVWFGAADAGCVVARSRGLGSEWPARSTATGRRFGSAGEALWMEWTGAGDVTVELTIAGTGSGAYGVLVVPRDGAGARVASTRRGTRCRSAMWWPTCRTTSSTPHRTRSGSCGTGGVAGALRRRTPSARRCGGTHRRVPAGGVHRGRRCADRVLRVHELDGGGGRSGGGASRALGASGPRSPRACQSLRAQSAVWRFGVLELADARAEYRIDVALAGEYVVYLTGEFAAGDAVGVRVAGGDEAVVRVGEATRVLCHRIPLVDGLSILTLRGLAGRPQIALVTALADPGVPAAADAGPTTIDGAGKRVVCSPDCGTTSSSKRSWRCNRMRWGSTAT